MSEGKQEVNDDLIKQGQLLQDLGVKYDKTQLYLAFHRLGDYFIKNNFNFNPVTSEMMIDALVSTFDLKRDENQKKKAIEALENFAGKITKDFEGAEQATAEVKEQLISQLELQLESHIGVLDILLNTIIITGESPTGSVFCKKYFENNKQVEIERTDDMRTLALIAQRQVQEKRIKQPLIINEQHQSVVIPLLLTIKEIFENIKEGEEKVINILNGPGHITPTQIRITKDGVKIFCLDSIERPQPKILESLEKFGKMEIFSVPITLYSKIGEGRQKDGKSCGVYSLTGLKVMEKMKSSELETAMSSKMPNQDIAIGKYTQDPQVLSRIESGLYKIDMEQRTNKSLKATEQKTFGEFFTEHVLKILNKNNRVSSFNYAIVHRNAVYLSRVMDEVKKTGMQIQEKAEKLSDIDHFRKEVLGFDKLEIKDKAMEAVFKLSQDFTNVEDIEKIFKALQGNENIQNVIIKLSDMKGITSQLYIAVIKDFYIKNDISKEFIQFAENAILKESFAAEDLLVINEFMNHTNEFFEIIKNNDVYQRIKEDLAYLEGLNKPILLKLYVGLVCENKLFENLENIKKLFGTDPKMLEISINTETLRSIIGNENNDFNSLVNNKASEFLKLSTNGPKINSVIDNLEEIHLINHELKLKVFKAILNNVENPILIAIVEVFQLQDADKNNNFIKILKNMSEEQLNLVFSNKCNVDKLRALVGTYSVYQEMEEDGTKGIVKQNIDGFLQACKENKPVPPHATTSTIYSPEAHQVVNQSKSLHNTA